MLELIVAPPNAPFAIALLVMLGIAAIEGVATLFGAGLTSLLDGLVGDVDFDVDIDVDADGDLGGGGGIPGSGLMTYTLGWLRVGQVPILVLLVIFLTAFGLGGIAVQSFVAGLSGHFLPAALASVPAVLIALPSVRIFGGVIARLLPKEETSAVSEKTFIGRVATITLGTAARGEPTQARLHDEHGRSHYVLVEPDLDSDRFETGTQVLLVRMDGIKFRVIAPPTELLLNRDND